MSRCGTSGKYSLHDIEHRVGCLMLVDVFFFYVLSYDLVSVRVFDGNDTGRIPVLTAVSYSSISRCLLKCRNTVGQTTERSCRIVITVNDM